MAHLTLRQKRKARREIKDCAHALLTNINSVHYTQTPARWDGIGHDKSPHRRGLLPFFGDCSSTATWMVGWRALRKVCGIVADILNGANYRAGYTGTLINHGRPVGRFSMKRVGDLVFYGNQGGGVPEHVAVMIRPGHVFSHGGEAGPFILPIDYRSDRVAVRRYI